MIEEVDFLPEKLPKKVRRKRTPEEKHAFRERVNSRLQSGIPILKYRDVIEFYVTGHKFEALAFKRVLKPGLFKCPLCGKRGRTFVDVIREDGKKFSIGWSCLSYVGLHFNKTSVSWEELPGERKVCINEKEYQMMIRKAEKELKMLPNLVMNNRRKHTITKEDLDMLLEDL
jgi:hypothetical protein